MGKVSKRAAENALLSLGNTMAGLIGALFLSIIISRMLGPERLGKYHTILWALSVVDLLVNMGIGMGATKFVAEYDGKGDRKSAAGIVIFSMKLRLVVALVLAGTLALSAGPLARFFNTPEARLFFWIAALTIIPNALQSLLAASLLGVQKYHYSTILTVISSPINLAVCALVLSGGLGVAGLLGWRVILFSLQFLFYLWAVRRELPMKEPGRLNPKLKKMILQFSGAVMFMNILDAIVWQRSEVFFLGKFSTMEEVGFYSLSFGLTILTMEVIGGALTSILMPLQSRAHGASDSDQLHRIYKESLRYLSMVTLPLAMGGIMLARPMTVTLYGEPYLPMVPVLMILFTSASLGRVGTAFSSVFYSTGKVGILIKLAIICAAINVGLDFILIPKYASLGAALANSSTQILALIPGPILIYKYYRFTMPMKSLAKIAANVFTMGGIVYLLRGHAYGVAPLLLVVLAGGAAYIAGAVAWRMIEPQDIEILRELAERLPTKMERAFNRLLDAVQRATR